MRFVRTAVLALLMASAASAVPPGVMGWFRQAAAQKATGPTRYVPDSDGLVYWCDFYEGTNSSGVYEDYYDPDVGLWRYSSGPTTGVTARYVADEQCVFMQGWTSGNGDSLAYTETDELVAASSATMMAWVRPASQYHVRDVKHRQGNNGSQVILRYQWLPAAPSTNYRPHWYAELGSSTYHPALPGDSYSIPLGRWTHLAWVYSGGTQTLYIDGAQAWSQAGVGATIDVKYHCAWGSRSTSSPTWWCGWMDDIAVYSRAWTGEELAQMVADTAHADPAWDGSASPYVLRYEFDAPGTNQWGFVQNDGAWPCHGVKHMDYAYPTMGNNGYLTCDASKRVVTGWHGTIGAAQNFALSAWIRRTGTVPNNSYWFGTISEEGANDTYIGAYLTSDTCKFVLNGNSSSPYDRPTDGSALTLNVWTHIALVRSVAADKWYVFRNGVRTGTTTDATTGTFAYTKDMPYVGTGGQIAGGSAYVDVDDVTFVTNGVTTNIVQTLYTTRTP